MKKFISITLEQPSFDVACFKASEELKDTFYKYSSMKFLTLEIINQSNGLDCIYKFEVDGESMYGDGSTAT